MSQDLHHQIYNTISELTQLRCLDFGYHFSAEKCRREPWPPVDQVSVPETVVVDGHVYHKKYPPSPNMLKLLFDSGLSRLRSLGKLKEFGFRELDHRVGSEELD
ncbi:hypothetical protein BGZ96_004463 [Linnemannia gamsii]|uniref:Uncharacterized protein n=1 Tax=Linnemannia gamsii TaxID=64522 RepID=A0ABQ7JI39_9FUNG|nr:hypothetical protein BGZ96_004463 [Linnemannia gamsii]